MTHKQAESIEPINAELRRRLARTDWELVTLRAKYEEAERRLQELDTVQHRVAAQEVAERRATAELQRKAEESEELTKQVSALTSEVGALRARAAELEEERNRWRVEGRTVRATVSELTVGLSRLRTELDSVLERVNLGEHPREDPAVEAGRAQSWSLSQLWRPRGKQ